MPSLRTLLVSDCKSVLQINAASVPGVAALDRAEFARLMAMPNYHVAIENEDLLVVGYALAFHSNAPYEGEEFQGFKRKLQNPFIYIDQVATQLESRRMGIGSAIYEALEGVARVSDVSTLCCEVNIDPPNPESMAFHEKLGFSQSVILATADGRTVALLTKGVHRKCEDPM